MRALAELGRARQFWPHVGVVAAVVRLLLRKLWQRQRSLLLREVNLRQRNTLSGHISIKIIRAFRPLAASYLVGGHILCILGIVAHRIDGTEVAVLALLGHLLLLLAHVEYVLVALLFEPLSKSSLGKR